MSDEVNAEVEAAPSEDAATNNHEAENAALKEKVRKMDETIKRNFEDAENWRKHQDSLKSEGERVAEEIAAAKRVAEESARELAVYKAIAKHGLTEEHAELLAGSDPEQIEAKAAKLAALIGDSSPFPKADPSQGAKGDPGKQTTADAFAGFIESQLNN